MSPIPSPGGAHHGGVTFPTPGTVVTVPISQSVSYNSSSPGEFRWSDPPNIAADPVDGTLYAVRVQYRVPNFNATAAVYIARGTPDASTWTTPIILDNSQPGEFQYMPWVSVSSDHAVHVTYGAAAPRRPTPRWPNIMSNPPTGARPGPRHSS